MPSKTFNVAGLFAGVGGIERGFQRAGFEIVAANEIDPYAAQTYAANNKHRLIVGDVSDLSGKQLMQDQHGVERKIHVLTGGFPCQPFSVAGHRLGFEDARGNVFWDIHRLINELDPEVIFLENVKNLGTHDSGRTFATILGALEGAIQSPNGSVLNNPYYVKSQVLNSKDFGIPQNRERVYIVGFKSKKAFEKFSFPEVNSSKPQDQNLADFIDFETKVDEKYYYRDNRPMFNELANSITDQETVYQWRRHYVRANKSGVCPTLTANMGMGGHNVPLVLTKHGIRKLTPSECFALMGLADEVFPDGLAESRLYKQAGNAVVVPVISEIANKIRVALSS
jgi:DNA (cytosine-5)-methyltransferase 1